MSENEAAGLTAGEREALLVPCECGHTLNDHGELAGCWACPEENAECSVAFETLLAERLAVVVAARLAPIEALLERPTWHRGMYGCPDDMIAARDLRAALTAAPDRGEGAGRGAV